MDNIEFITKVVTDLENGKKVDLGDIEKVSSLRDEAAELYYKSDRITIPNELYDRLTRAMRNNNIKVNILLRHVPIVYCCYSFSNNGQNSKCQKCFQKSKI